MDNHPEESASTLRVVAMENPRPTPPAPGAAPSLPRRRSYLRAALGALGLAALVLACSGPIFEGLERPYLRPLLADPFENKDQGLVLQREAFQRPDVLPLYGSSELRNAMGQRPDHAFYHEPSGFQVCPVGGAGNTTLMNAQKIAALGKAVEGRKVAFILSTTWFRRTRIPSPQLAGNFSALQAITFLRNADIEPALRDRFINRLLDQPDGLKEQPMVLAYLRTLNQPGWMTGMERNLRGLGLGLYAAQLHLEDHENMLGEVFNEPGMLKQRSWAPRPGPIDWNALIAEKEKESRATTESKKAAGLMRASPLVDGGVEDEQFCREVESSREWEDFALLLDTLKSLRAKPLMISVPFAGWFMDLHGISQSARQFYYRKFEDVCAKAGVPCATFSEHEQDPDFLEGVGTHLEVKGWLYVNRLLEDFYLDRPLPKPVSKAS